MSQTQDVVNRKSLYFTRRFPIAYRRSLWQPQWAQTAENCRLTDAGFRIVENRARKSIGML